MGLKCVSDIKYLTKAHLTLLMDHVNMNWMQGPLKRFAEEKTVIERFRNTSHVIELNSNSESGGEFTHFFLFVFCNFFGIEINFFESLS